MSTSIIIELYDEKGQWIGRAFQCKIDPDNPDTWEYDPIPDIERDEFLRNHDPNKIDGRHVRKQLGDHMVNLGMKVNKLGAGCHKRRLR